MSWIRWLLIVPACILGWYLLFTIGMGLLGAVQFFCAEEDMINGRCLAPWYTDVKEAGIIFLAGMSAVTVVFAAYFVAPTRKTTTAIVAFLIGSAAATYVVITTDSWFEYAAAIVGGLMAAFSVYSRGLQSNSLQSNSAEETGFQNDC